MIALVFDTETTSLIESTFVLPINKRPEIVEFYGEKIDLDSEDDLPLSCMNMLFHPWGEIDPGATKTHGLTKADLLDQDRFSAHAENIKLFIESADIAIAHNISFDKEMIDWEFERLRETIKWPKLLCTVEATVHLKGYRLSLGNLHEYLFGSVFTDAHRARADVQALVRCVRELRRRGEI